MNVTEAVTSRRSIRQFLDTPVPRDVLQRLLETAQRAPSGGNTQPWNAVVLTGEPLQVLIAAVVPKVWMADMRIRGEISARRCTRHLKSHVRTSQPD
jgi:nitroreductase